MFGKKQVACACHYTLVEKHALLPAEPIIKVAMVTVKILILTHSIRDTDLSVPTLCIRDTDSSVCTHVAVENMHRTSLNCVFHRVIS